MVLAASRLLLDTDMHSEIAHNNNNNNVQAPFLKSYTQYCAQFEASNDLLGKLSNTPRFKRFLKVCLSSASVNPLVFGSTTPTTPCFFAGTVAGTGAGVGSVRCSLTSDLLRNNTHCLKLGAWVWNHT
jgi:hypothetical protein